MALKSMTKKENGNRYQFRIEQKDDVMLVREQQEERTRAKETDNLPIHSTQIRQWDIQDRSCIC